MLTLFGGCPRKLSTLVNRVAVPRNFLGVLWTVFNLKWLPPHSADPLPGISVSGLWFRCFRNGISKSLAPERLDFNISGSGASRFQDFQLRSVRISIFQGPERQNQEFSMEIEDL